MSESFKNHIPLPLDTAAFKCARCGAVALDRSAVCEVQGKVYKRDWCGSESIEMPLVCENLKNNIRYKCRKCGRVAINPGLLCEPEKLPMP